MSHRRRRKVEMIKGGFFDNQGEDDEFKGRKIKELDGGGEVVVIVRCGLQTPLQQQQQKLPDDLLLECLLRVPLKNLYQCKAVSKYCCSVIGSPIFLQAYLSRYNGGLLVSIAEEEEEATAEGSTGEVQLRFYYSALMQGHQQPDPFFCRFKLPTTRLYKGLTQVINGIACVCEQERLCVCNVCTGEALRLPDPLPTGRSSYFLGHDPVSKVYKLLRLNKNPTGRTSAAARFREVMAFTLDRYYQEVAIHEPGTEEHSRATIGMRKCWEGVHAYRQAALAHDDYPLECEILTLGCDSSWRKLDVASDFGDEIILFDTESLSLNGVLYWFNQLLGPRAGLISFHLHQEKFQLVKPPQDERLSSLHRSLNIKLTQFSGRIALSCIAVKPECHLVLHVLEDNEGDLWTSHDIPFPPEFGDFASIGTVPVGNLPTGQLLLANPRGKALAKEFGESYLPIYAYDHEKHKFEKFVVGRLPESLDSTGFRVSISFLVENTVRSGDLFSEW